MIVQGDGAIVKEPLRSGATPGEGLHWLALTLADSPPYLSPLPATCVPDHARKVTCSSDFEAHFLLYLQPVILSNPGAIHGPKCV
jgi:hypothetical protein